MDKVYDHASYITVNIHHPIRQGCVICNLADSLNELLQGVKQQQTRLADARGRYVPVAVKIAPDMDSEAIKLVADTLVSQGMDGVIATNTTIAWKPCRGIAMVRSRRVEWLAGTGVIDPGYYRVSRIVAGRVAYYWCRRYCEWR